ncbi:hypothetical protein D3C77_640180 [compost metagenome]
MLGVHVFKCPVLEGTDEVFGEGVVKACYVEMICSNAGLKAAVLAVQHQVLSGSLVAISDFGETTRHDIKGLDFSNTQQSTSEGLREYASVVGFNGRHVRDQRSYLKQAF